ncbi:MAG: hypothetical protein COB81_09085 [Flavobacteriaceae bacterium]|nr:MAG: hypothetical protein COB81_09085 [Flavobacteriaceae bacterium]
MIIAGLGFFFYGKCKYQEEVFPNGSQTPAIKPKYTKKRLKVSVPTFNRILYNVHVFLNLNLMDSKKQLIPPY